MNDCVITPSCEWLKEVWGWAYQLGWHYPARERKSDRAERLCPLIRPSAVCSVTCSSFCACVRVPPAKLHVHLRLWLSSKIWHFHSDRASLTIMTRLFQHINPLSSLFLIPEYAGHTIRARKSRNTWQKGALYSGAPPTAETSTNYIL